MTKTKWKKVLRLIWKSSLVIETITFVVAMVAVFQDQWTKGIFYLLLSYVIREGRKDDEQATSRAGSGRS